MCSRNRNQWSGCRSLFCSLQTKIQTPVCDSLSLYWHQAVLFRVYPWKCECLWICQAFPTTVERKKERAPQGRLWHTPQQLPQSTDCCDHNPEARYPPWTFSTHSSSLALSDDFTKKNTWGGIRRKVKSEDSVLMPVLGCWLRWDSLLSWFHPTHREPSPVFLDSISSMGSAHTGSKLTYFGLNCSFISTCQMRKRIPKDVQDVCWVVRFLYIRLFYSFWTLSRLFLDFLIPLSSMNFRVMLGTVAGVQWMFLEWLYV